MEKNGRIWEAHTTMNYMDKSLEDQNRRLTNTEGTECIEKLLPLRPKCRKILIMRQTVPLKNKW